MFANLVRELQRRRIPRAAALYFAVAWGSTEALQFILEAWRLPEWTSALLAAAFVVGFPIAMLLVWVFDLGPDGVRRTTPTSTRGRFTIVAALALLVGGATGLFYLIYPQPYDGDLQIPPDGSLQSIAVLPFEALGGSGEDTPQWFADGIHDEVLTRLSRLRSLRTISRTSSMPYRDSDKRLPEIAAELRVSHVLEGSVQRVDETVRINVQLIDAVADQHVWSDSYERTLSAAEIFSIQSEIGESVARELQMMLSAEERRTLAKVPTENLDAYRLFQQGNYLFHRRDATSLQSAIDTLAEAVTLDPGFAVAWTLLAAAYSVAPVWIGTDRDETDRLARRAARRAIELDGTLGEPWAVLAGVDAERGNWSAAAKGFRAAIALEPNNALIRQWYSEFLHDTGRLDAAWVQALAASDLDPLSPIIVQVMTYAAFARGDNDEALRNAARATELGVDAWTNYSIAGLAYLRLEDLNSARALLLQAHATQPLVWPPPLVDGVLDRDKRSQALTALSALERNGAINSHGIFFYHAILGDMDNAYRGIHRAIDDRLVVWGDVWLPEMSAFREDSRFAALADDVGWTEYWDEEGWPDQCSPTGNGLICR